MIHIIHLIQRRFPNRSGRMIALLVLASAAVLAIGVAILILR